MTRPSSTVTATCSRSACDRAHSMCRTRYAVVITPSRPTSCRHAPADRRTRRQGRRPSASTAWLRSSGESFGDDNAVTFAIRDHALVISVACPSWPIEKREPVALQPFSNGVDGGPGAHLHTQVRVPNELARAVWISESLDVWSVHQFQPPAPRKRQEIRSEALAFILISRVRPRVEVLLVEGFRDRLE
jgi:hypothetical protein